MPEEKVRLDRFRPRREQTWSLIGLAITLAATGLVLVHAGQGLVAASVAGRHLAVAMHLGLTVVVLGLVYGAVVYLLARWAWARRLGALLVAWTPPSPWPTNGATQGLSILVPSYKEEPGVVLMTLMSAALQDYPVRRVVLLVDDPPDATSQVDADRTRAMRAVVKNLAVEFADQRDRFGRARVAFAARAASAPLDLAVEARVLANAYCAAANWVQARIDAHPRRDHVDSVYVDKVLTRRRDDFIRASLGVLDLAFVADADARAFEREHDRLVASFTVDVQVFERKRFENMSHEPNKAMNLNSYLGLMGRRFDDVTRGGRRFLEPSPTGSFMVPWTPYVLTLDADSLLLPEYASRLIGVLEAPGNDRVAVAQTPYSAFPDAPGRIERIAGATTDIQYVIHQGFTGFDATYWVGANAVIRRSALEDIATTIVERGHAVRRFIQDRTVIEDTESSIDLVAAGWRLTNYPERLAYSATPPDFGSLAVQRARWANGGLLIFPKLLSLILRGGSLGPGALQAAMRAHYLVSIALVNVGLVIMLAVPLPADAISPFLPLTALPYYALYARDLRLLGYRAVDVIGVYALNLLLIPVNLAGVAASVVQGVKRSKTPFVRTPKVRDRTATSAWFLVVEVALVSWWMTGAVFSFAAGRYVHGAFAFGHALALAAAIVAFIGLRAMVEDVMVQWFTAKHRDRARSSTPRHASHPVLARDIPMGVLAARDLEAAPIADASAPSSALDSPREGQQTPAIAGHAPSAQPFELQAPDGLVSGP